MAILNDSEIVELYLQRDEAAIDKTAEKFGARLRALACRIVGNLQTAEECENDAYLKAWQSIPPHEPRSYLYAFLARLARNISLNVCRKRNALKRSAFISELSDELLQCIPAPDNTECRMDDAEFAKAINGFLGELREQNRNIFVRRYFYLDSVADIAARFGISEGNVKTALFRSREKLKKRLIKEGYTL